MLQVSVEVHLHTILQVYYNLGSVYAALRKTDLSMGAKALGAMRAAVRCVVPGCGCKGWMPQVSLAPSWPMAYSGLAGELMSRDAEAGSSSAEVAEVLRAWLLIDPQNAALDAGTLLSILSTE